MVIRVLFVDDEKKILDGLRRLLRPFRKEWEMVFAQSGEEALKILETGHFDVIVSDMRMPGMDGAELLNKVKTLYPHMVRIILSGYSDYETILKSIGPTHRYLSKPCDTEKLKNTIVGAISLNKLLQSEKLRRIVCSMDTIPSIPNIYNELMDALKAPNATLEEVGRIIAKDAGMTSQILRIVNSAFFGLYHEVVDPGMAVNLLGINTINSLILSLHIFKQIEPQLLNELRLEDLWDHNLCTGIIARTIMMSEAGDKKLADDSFTAGLLHDIGKLILAVNFHDNYARMLEKVDGDVPSYLAEEREFGVNHAHIGAYLMGLWGLPNPVVEALAYHYKPSLSPVKEFSALSAVHAASCLDLATRKGVKGENSIDRAYFEDIGKLERLEAWKELAVKSRKGEKSRA